MSKNALSKRQFIYHSLWTLKILITVCHGVLLLIYYVFYMLFI